MKETFHYASSDYIGAGPLVNQEQAEERRASLTSGHYQDPNPKLVAYINKRFTDPQENIAAALMKSLELAGIIKSIKEIQQMAKPLEMSGLLPVVPHGDEPPQYLVDPTKSTEFMDLRDEQLLLELQEGNNDRNELLTRVRDAVVGRLAYDEEQERELWTYARTFTKTNELPPAFRVLRVMVGMFPPEDPANKPISEVPELTRDLAPDIFIMMLRDEDEAKLQSTSSVA